MLPCERNIIHEPLYCRASVATIAQKSGITIPTGTKILLAQLKGVGKDFPLSVEVLAPILAFYSCPITIRHQSMYRP